MSENGGELVAKVVKAVESAKKTETDKDMADFFKEAVIALDVASDGELSVNGFMTGFKPSEVFPYGITVNYFGFPSEDGEIRSVFTFSDKVGSPKIDGKFYIGVNTNGNEPVIDRFSYASQTVGKDQAMMAAALATVGVIRDLESKKKL
jgi:hypothetical protein